MASEVYNDAPVLAEEKCPRRQRVNHGSPWCDVTFVPIVFVGNGLPAQRVSRSVKTVDIAATLAAYLGLKPPSGLVGAAPD